MGTGKGGVAQTSLLQNGLWANGCFVQNRLFGEHVAHRPPRVETPSALANHYRCRDGRWFLMALHNEARQLAAFLKAIDAEHLAQDPRFHTQPQRRAHHRELTAILDEVFAKRDLAGLGQLRADVPRRVSAGSDGMPRSVFARGRSAAARPLSGEARVRALPPIVKELYQEMLQKRFV